ncbi:MAG: hypothetical protein JXM71_06370, partial [Spirochaetales bacterium]|nr:hypothetical protein [Spirochaetales bacterium]
AKAGIFFGARTFMSKLGQTLAGLIVPSLLLLGADIKSSANAVVADVVVADIASGGAITGTFGVRATAAVAAIFCALGFALFIMYDEKKVLSILASKENVRDNRLS